MQEASEAILDEDRKTGGRRIQFEFSPDAYSRLRQMKDATNASSYAELVRSALRVYEWIVQQERAGYSLAVVKDDKLVKEVKFLY